MAKLFGNVDFFSLHSFSSSFFFFFLNFLSAERFLAPEKVWEEDNRITKEKVWTVLLEASVTRR